jgi:hypothetical protein
VSGSGSRYYSTNVSFFEGLYIKLTCEKLSWQSGEPKLELYRAIWGSGKNLLDLGNFSRVFIVTKIWVIKLLEVKIATNG